MGGWMGCLGVVCGDGEVLKLSLSLSYRCR